MNENIENAINALAGQITAKTCSQDALRYAQAILNLAQAATALENADRAKK